MPSQAVENNTPAAENPVLAECLSLGVDISENLETCKADLASEQRLCAAELKLKVDSAKASSEIKVKGAEERIKILQAALEESEARADREIWEHPGWWFAGGILVATAIVYGSVWSVGQLRPAIPPA